MRSLHFKDILSGILSNSCSSTQWKQNTLVSNCSRQEALVLVSLAYLSMPHNPSFKEDWLLLRQISAWDAVKEASYLCHISHNNYRKSWGKAHSSLPSHPPWIGFRNSDVIRWVIGLFWCTCCGSIINSCFCPWQWSQRENSKEAAA